MKSKLPFIRMKHLFLMLFALSLDRTIVAAQCGTTVLWHNLSDGPGGSSPGVLLNVVDQNIDIQGTNALVEGIHVEARTCDILITVTNIDSTITGSGDRLDNVPTNSARLYLYAAPGRTITFALENDLLFRGTANGPIPLDLLVTVSGGGEVVFFIEGGNQVSFSSTVSSGGTQLFVGMETVNPSTLSFSRFQPLGTHLPNQDINVNVGPRSCISFMAVTPIASGATETATIRFDPSNTGLGKAFFNLAQSSCVVLYGHYLTVPLASEIQLNDIALNTPAGYQANFLADNINAANNNAAAALQIVNNNQVLTNYLINPFCQDGAFTGTQAGFILGPNGVLVVNNLTYIDYIGTATNQVPNPNTPVANLQPYYAEQVEENELTTQDLFKARNPSAFIIDGFDDPNALPAQIILNGSSAIYFRSGCDDDGDVSPTFTIDPLERTFGAGNVVFDIEGPLEVQGDPAGNTALNVLSIQVTGSGCSVFPESSETQFPQRTFAVDENGLYLSYNNACFLVNNRVNMRDTCLLHTDTNHIVLERDNLGITDLASEPTYIGGDTFRICLPVDQPRPTIALYNSFIRYAESAGFTGVDILVPNNDQVAPNESTFRFYSNGRAIDNAYGRYVILGTNLGSTSANGGVLISKDSHLDIFQTTPDGEPDTHMLTLDVNYNTSCITQGITGNIEGQYSVHSIWLGNESNISIGTNADVGTAPDGSTFPLTTTPTLFINGDFMSFVSHGGSRGLPETSGTTGQGGIFVDTNGVISITPDARANVATMVTKSHNGIINLPKRQVYFAYRVGITNWNIMLSQAAQRVLIPADQSLSDFTMDWGAVTKDYTSTDSFVPYEPPFTPAPCDCFPVTDANLRALPLVQGSVEQFQVKRSRIGDQMHLVCDGGFIRELIFLTGYNTAEAAVGFMVVQNNGRVGLGSARTTIDSTQAEIVLGINGVTICANGDGVIELNDNVIINNVCHIVTGTSFAVDGPQTLEIHSDDPVELRIKSTGLLDLSSFNTPDKIIKFGGQVIVVFEPGSQLVMGGGTLIFTDLARVSFERILNNNLLVGTQPSGLDPSRVKWVGTGDIIFAEGAIMLVHDDSFLGIESGVPPCPIVTDLRLILQDDARLQIGNDDEPGGVLQVGNTQCVPNGLVNFRLIARGFGSQIQIARRGLLGLGVGIVNKLSPIPNQWQVGCLDNVATVSIAIEEGLFRHNEIFTGDSANASLLAIGPAQDYTFAFDHTRSSIQGGGNMVLVSGCLTNTCQPEVSLLSDGNRVQNSDPKTLQAILDRAEELIMKADSLSQRMQDLMATRAFIDGALSITPTVTTFSGFISADLSAGIMASKDMLEDNSQPAQPVGVSPAALFAYLEVQDHDSYFSPKSTIGLTEFNVTTLGYVVGTTIRRQNWARILGGARPDPVSPTVSLNRGSVSLNLDNANLQIDNVIEIQGS